MRVVYTFHSNATGALLHKPSLLVDLLSSYYYVLGYATNETFRGTRFRACVAFDVVAWLHGYNCLRNLFSDM